MEAVAQQHAVPALGLQANSMPATAAASASASASAAAAAAPSAGMALQLQGPGAAVGSISAAAPNAPREAPAPPVQPAGSLSAAAQPDLGPSSDTRLPGPAHEAAQVKPAAAGVDVIAGAQEAAPRQQSQPEAMPAVISTQDAPAAAAKPLEPPAPTALPRALAEQLQNLPDLASAQLRGSAAASSMPGVQPVAATSASGAAELLALQQMLGEPLPPALAQLHQRLVCPQQPSMPQSNGIQPQQHRGLDTVHMQQAEQRAPSRPAADVPTLRDQPQPQPRRNPLPGQTQPSQQRSAHAAQSQVGLHLVHPPVQCCLPLPASLLVRLASSSMLALTISGCAGA